MQTRNNDLADRLLAAIERALRKGIAKIPQMGTRQRMVLWLGSMFGLVMGFYPPWIASLSIMNITLSERDAGYHFVRHPPATDDLRFATAIFPELLSIHDPEKWDDKDVEVEKWLQDKLRYQVDTLRLGVHFGILLIGMTGLLWALASRSKPRTAE